MNFQGHLENSQAGLIHAAVGEIPPRGEGLRKFVPNSIASTISPLPGDDGCHFVSGKLDCYKTTY